MDLMIIGKYPPIEGGESGKLYWLCKGLSSRGNRIHVVSNGQEVEPDFKCAISERETDELQPKNVTLHQTDVGAPYFIPQYTPHSEKLTALALDVIKDNNVELILGWYLLPYGVSARNVSSISRKNYLIQHAGSDIKRLLKNSMFHSFLKQVILDARGVMSYPSFVELFRELGCQRINVHRPAIPPEFNPYQDKVNFKTKYGLELNPDKTVLYLGKLGKGKALTQLIDAFKELDHDCSLVIIGGGKEKAALKQIAKGLENIFFLDPIPIWRVPETIRGVRCVVVPEHNFGVSMHRSRIPIESLMCGVTPVVSSEISRNYGQFSDYFITFNPLNVRDLKESLESTLNNDEPNAKARENYPIMRAKVGRFDEYIEEMEKLFLNSIAT